MLKHLGDSQLIPTWSQEPAPLPSDGMELGSSQASDPPEATPRSPRKGKRLRKKSAQGTQPQLPPRAGKKYRDEGWETVKSRGRNKNPTTSKVGGEPIPNTGTGPAVPQTLLNNKFMVLDPTNMDLPGKQPVEGMEEEVGGGVMCFCVCV